MRRDPTRLIGLALVLVTLAVFWPVQRFEFVNYDDPDNVTANPQVLAGLTPAGVRWALTNGEVGMWIPLTWLSLMLDAECYGANPRGFHLTNLLLHTLATMLLFGALRRLTNQPWRSGLVAALFAWHPFHVESVAWITERRDVLSACFAMLTIGLYARYAQQPSLARYLAVVAVFTLGLMSKPMLVTLPGVLLLLDWWPLGRQPTNANAPTVIPSASEESLNSAAARRQRFLPSFGMTSIVEKIPLFCLAAIAALATLTFQSQIGSVATTEQLPVGARVGNALVGYTRYLGKTLWPVDFAVFYPYNTSLPAGQTIGAAVLLGVFTAGAVWLARRKPVLPVGWFWFVGTLFPVIGVFQAGSQSIADHYSYLAIIGLFIMAAWAAPARPVWVGAGVVVLVACAVLSRRQLAHWQTSETLFRHALAVTTDNWTAHQNLGEALETQGRDAEAAGHYRAVLQLRPDHAEAHFNLANVLARQGQQGAAARYYERALAFQPNYPKAHVNLGNLLLQTGRVDDAIRCYRAALVLQPTMAEAHNNLGLALAARGDWASAVRHYEAALRVWPDSDDVRANLAAARRRLERAQPALQPNDGGESTPAKRSD